MWCISLADRSVMLWASLDPLWMSLSCSLIKGSAQSFRRNSSACSKSYRDWNGCQGGMLGSYGALERVTAGKEGSSGRKTVGDFPDAGWYWIQISPSSRLCGTSELWDCKFWELLYAWFKSSKDDNKYLFSIYTCMTTYLNCLYQMRYRSRCRCP